MFIGRTVTEAETPILWPPDAKNWLIGKDPDAGKDGRQKEKGTTEDETVGWYHWLNGHEFEQIPGVGDGQGSLVCCSPWGRKESDTTEWLNWTEGRKTLIHLCSQECPFPFLMFEYWKHTLASDLSLPSSVVHFKCTLAVQEKYGAEAAQQCPEHLLWYPLLVTSSQSQ